MRNVKIDVTLKSPEAKLLVKGGVAIEGPMKLTLMTPGERPQCAWADSADQRTSLTLNTKL